MIIRDGKANPLDCRPSPGVGWLLHDSRTKQLRSKLNRATCIPADQDVRD